MKYIIGVDEAGRGPLAGPITLSAFCALQNLKAKLIEILGGKVRDSKQFSPDRRKKIYREFLKLRKEEKVLFVTSHVSNRIIDKKGISHATRLGVEKCLKKVGGRNYFKIKNLKLKILLDGLLQAPSEYKNQKTIVGGDGKDIFIACASITAKVRRDRLLARLAKKYPRYQLAVHKGYGTALHRRLIKKYGLSPLHRKSFCKNIFSML